MSSYKHVHRHTVPVDDQQYSVLLTGNPLAVAAASTADGIVVEFWAEHHDDGDTVYRHFRVYGTGQPIPDDAQWRGTTSRVLGLVWHLYELP